jgi:hypothetical protein
VQNGSLGLTGKYSVGAQKAVFLLYSVRNTSADPSQPSQIESSSVTKSRRGLNILCRYKRVLL